MSTSTGITRRQLARVACITLFVGVQATTDLFVQYPLLGWMALLVLLVVLGDAALCTGRRLRDLRGTPDESDGDPGY